MNEGESFDDMIARIDREVRALDRQAEILESRTRLALYAVIAVAVLTNVLMTLTGNFEWGTALWCLIAIMYGWISLMKSYQISRLQKRIYRP